MGTYLIGDRSLTAQVAPYVALEAMLRRWTSMVLSAFDDPSAVGQGLQPVPDQWCALHLAEDLMDPVQRLRAQQALDRLTGHAQARSVGQDRDPDGSGRIRADRWQAVAVGLASEPAGDRLFRRVSSAPPAGSDGLTSTYCDVGQIQALMIRQWAEPQWTHRALDGLLSHLRTQPGIFLHPFDPLTLTVHPGVWAALFVTLAAVDEKTVSTLHRRGWLRQVLQALGLRRPDVLTAPEHGSSPLLAGLILLRRASRGLIRREGWASFWDQLLIAELLSRCPLPTQPLDATAAAVLKGLPVLAAPAYAALVDRLEARAPQGGQVLRAAATTTWRGDMPPWLVDTPYDPRTADRPSYR